MFQLTSPWNLVTFSPFNTHKMLLSSGFRDHSLSPGTLSFLRTPPPIKTLVLPGVLQGPLSFLFHPSSVHPPSAICRWPVISTSVYLSQSSQAPDSYFDCLLNIFPWMCPGLSESTSPNEFIIVSSIPHLLMSVIGTSIHPAIQPNNLGLLNSLSLVCQHLT